MSWNFWIGNKKLSTIHNSGRKPYPPVRILCGSLVDSPNSRRFDPIYHQRPISKAKPPLCVLSFQYLSVEASVLSLPALGPLSLCWWKLTVCATGSYCKQDATASETICLHRSRQTTISSPKGANAVTAKVMLRANSERKLNADKSDLGPNALCSEKTHNGTIIRLSQGWAQSKP